MACPCRARKITFEPSADAEMTRDHLVRLYASHDPVGAEERAGAMFLQVCLHEAGHAVAAAACGRTTVSASVGGGAPYVGYGPDVSRSLLHALIYTSAGDVAQHALRGEIFSPSWPALGKYISWARADESGFCDSCWIASALVRKFPHEDDDLIATWRGVIWIVNSLFGDDEVASATRTLARELQTKTLLHGDEIEAVVNQYDLTGALRRACEGADLEGMLPCWR